MKKYLILALLLIGSPALADTVTLSPSNFYTGSWDGTLTGSVVTDLTNPLLCSINEDNTPGPCVGNGTGEIGNLSGNTDVGTWAVCLTDGDAGIDYPASCTAIGYYTVHAQNGVRDLVSVGETAYQDTTGESLGGSVSWAGDNLVLLFIGSGLALLYNLRWWIVALIIIGACVFFAYRAKRFFKH